MDDLFGSILTLATGPDGKVNKAKLLEGLQLSPHSPEAILISAFFHADESFKALKVEQRESALGVKRVLDAEMSQLVRALAAHRKNVEDASQQLDFLLTQREAALKAWSNEIGARSNELLESARALKASSAEVKTVNEAFATGVGNSLRALKANAESLTLKALAAAEWGMFATGALVGVGLTIGVVYWLFFRDKTPS